ncbi:MAG TPA: hypothetical protein VK993_14640 [Chthoniobacterales bacterium]|nr:hypothetical protein [Chthoniobacterales bacterium]
MFLLSACDLQFPPDYISEPHFHVYAYGETVRFGLGGDSHRFKLHGWSHTEPAFTWTEGIGASLIFFVPRTPRQLTLTMRLKPFVHAPDLTVQPVHLSINGRKVATWEVTEEKVYTVAVPHDFVAARPDAVPGRHNLRDSALLVLDFLIPNAQFPALLEAAPDWRRLGIACSELRIREGREHKAAAPVARVQEESEDPSYTLGTVVRFGAGDNAELYKRGGWHNAEGGSTWTGQEPAVLGFKLEQTRRPLALTLITHGNILPPRLAVQPTLVYANKRQIAEWQVDEMGEYMAEIPADAIGPDGVLTVEFVSKNATSPQALGVNTDSRLLGIACFELLLTDADE